MTTGQAFLRAICANPDDVTPRLIYADWLEENGQEDRGIFIRIQCELAQTHDPHSDAYWDGQLGDGPEHYQRRKALRRRERELRNEDFLDVLPGLARYYDPGSVEYGWLVKRVGQGSRRIAVEFRRGFVEAVSTRAELWLAHGPEIVACQPVIRLDVTGLQTYRREYGGDDRWAVHRNSLPWGIWQAICDGNGQDYYFVEASTKEEVTADVGKYLLRWARKKNGLPFLSQESTHLNVSVRTQI